MSLSFTHRQPSIVSTFRARTKVSRRSKSRPSTARLALGPHSPQKRVAPWAAVGRSDRRQNGLSLTGLGWAKPLPGRRAMEDVPQEWRLLHASDPIGEVLTSLTTNVPRVVSRPSSSKPKRFRSKRRRSRKSARKTRRNRSRTGKQKNQSVIAVPCHVDPQVTMVTVEQTAGLCWGGTASAAVQGHLALEEGNSISSQSSSQSSSVYSAVGDEVYLSDESETDTELDEIDPVSPTVPLESPVHIPTNLTLGILGTDFPFGSDFGPEAWSPMSDDEHEVIVADCFCDDLNEFYGHVFVDKKTKPLPTFNAEGEKRGPTLDPASARGLRFQVRHLKPRTTDSKKRAAIWR